MKCVEALTWSWATDSEAESLPRRCPSSTSTWAIPFLAPWAFFLHCPARDFHCGLRGFAMESYNRMDLRTTGMEFASEMVVKASLFGMQVTEVPTTLCADGRSRAPHLRTWRDGWRHLRFLLLYSPRWLFFYPGLFLMAIGLLVGAWLLPGLR